jgi:predicted ATPase/Tfp pilus assembly protein PilF
VADAAPATLGKWREHAPEALFLVTSRSRLRLRGEIVLDLPPLEVEDALDLFLGAAQRAREGFTVSGEEEVAARELVQRLDGIPLAIELAGARTRVMSPSKILVRLSRRFDLLAGAEADGVPRQATLRAAIDWSWELLSEAEQVGLAQCAVFRGTFSLEAAEAVISLGEGSGEVMDLVDSLCGKSMVQSRMVGGEIRFVLYDSIREYALERLPAEEAVAVRQRHARFFVEEGQEHIEEFGAPEGSDLAWFLENRENLLAIATRPETAREDRLQSVLLLSHMMIRRGPYEEHLRLLSGALEEAESPGVLVEAQLCFARGVARSIVGDIEGAESDLDRALDLCESGGLADLLPKVLLQRGVHDIRRGRLQEAISWLDKGLEAAPVARRSRVRARLLASLGMAKEAGADFIGAETRYLEALALARATQDRWEEVRTRSKMGTLCSFQPGRRKEAREHFEWALSRAHVIGELFIEAGSAYNLGRLNLNEGHLDAAQECLDTALAAYLDMGNRSSVAFIRLSLGLLALERGDLDTARDQVGRSVVTHQAVGNVLAHAYALSTLGLLELDAGQPALALQLGEEAVAALEPLGHKVLLGISHCVIGLAALGLEQDPAPSLTQARELVGDSGWGEGQAMLDVLEHLAGNTAQASELVHGHARSRIALRAQAGPLERSVDEAPNALVVQEKGRWFRAPGGERVDLSRKRTLRPLLLKLVTWREEEPGEALDVEQLFRAVWPGERILERAKKNRVYVSVATLRRLGLDSLLDTRGDGYLLRPEVEVVWRD